MINLLIKAECTDPKCGATLQLIQESEGSANYTGICGGCGAEYSGQAQVELTPPPGDATATKTTTAPKTSSTTAGATT